MASLKCRNGSYYIQYYLGGKQLRVSTGTDVLQIAKEKLRQFESAQLRGEDSPLPTRTPIAQVVSAYVQHIRTFKTAKSAQTDIYYLREMFGPVCPDLEVTSRRLSMAAKKRPPKEGQDRRRRAQVIQADCFEQIGTPHVAAFITGQVQSRGLAPKTANRYRPRIAPGGWYFPSPDGKRWDPDNFSQDLRAANDGAKLHWSCLDYRHTFGSQLAMKGESLYKIAKLMGNSPEICRRHYAALIPEAMGDSVEFAHAPLRATGT